jgi:Gram-negative bacterial TonB protein C-terminal
MSWKRWLVAFAALSVCSVFAQDASPEGAVPRRRETGSLGVMYTRDASAVWTELQGLIRGLRIGIDASDKISLLITRRQRFVDSRAGYPPRPPDWNGLRPESFQLHVFVPRSATPARVYVGSIVFGTDPTNYKRSAQIYNGGDVERWLIGRLGQRLNERGHWIPDDPEARMNLSRQLRPELAQDPCFAPATSPPIPASRSIVPPKLLGASKFVPVYPYDKRRLGAEDRQRFSAVIREDGVVSEIRLENDGVPPDEFTISGGNAISFWRYEPATLDGCAVSVQFTIITDFRMR